MVTDGNPTVSIGCNPESNDNDYFAHVAANIADVHKQNDIRIVGVLIGDNINVNNLTSPIISDGNGKNFTPNSNFILSDHGNNGAPTENVDYFKTDFANLSTVLNDLLSTIC